jgi:hypothetical protein
MFSSDHVAHRLEAKSRAVSASASASASRPTSPTMHSIVIDDSVLDGFESSLDQSNSMAIHSLDSQDQLFQTTAGGAKTF